MLIYWGVATSKPQTDPNISPIKSPENQVQDLKHANDNLNKAIDDAKKSDIKVIHDKDQVTPVKDEKEMSDWSKKASSDYQKQTEDINNQVAQKKQELAEWNAQRQKQEDEFKKGKALDQTDKAFIDNNFEYNEKADSVKLYKVNKDDKGNETKEEIPLIKGSTQVDTPRDFYETPSQNANRLECDDVDADTHLYARWTNAVKDTATGKSYDLVIELDDAVVDSRQNYGNKKDPGKGIIEIFRDPSSGLAFNYITALKLTKYLVESGTDKIYQGEDYFTQDTLNRQLPDPEQATNKRYNPAKQRAEFVKPLDGVEAAFVPKDSYMESTEHDISQGNSGAKQLIDKLNQDLPQDKKLTESVYISKGAQVKINDQNQITYPKKESMVFLTKGKASFLLGIINPVNDNDPEDVYVGPDVRKHRVRADYTQVGLGILDKHDFQSVEKPALHYHKDLVQTPITLTKTIHYVYDEDRTKKVFDDQNRSVVVDKTFDPLDPKSATYQSEDSAIKVDQDGKVSLAGADLPIKEGYSTSLVPNEAVKSSTVSVDNPSQEYTVVYTANTQTVTIKYVDDDNNGKQVGSDQPVHGKTDETVKLTYTIPAGYDYVSGEEESHTMTPNDKTVITVHLNHKHDTTTKTVNKEITYQTTDGKKVAEPYKTSVTIHKETDKVTGKKTYTANGKTLENGTTTLGSQKLPSKTGYYAATVPEGATSDSTVSFDSSNVNVDVVYKKLGKIIPVDQSGKEIPGANNPTYNNDKTDPRKAGDTNTPTVPGYTTTKTTVPGSEIKDPGADTPVTYKANTQTITIKYVDDDNNGEQVGSDQIEKGKTDETKTLKYQIPDKYDYVSGKEKDHKFTPDDKTVITVHLKHHHTQDEKTITKTITYKTDKGETVAKDFTQSVKIHKDTDEVTGKLTYTINGKASESDKTTLGFQNLPLKNGYYAAEVPAGASNDSEVDFNSKDVNVDVVYKKLGKIIPVDQSGTPIKDADTPTYENDPKDPRKTLPTKTPTVPGYTTTVKEVDPKDNPSGDTKVVYTKIPEEIPTPAPIDNPPHTDDVIPPENSNDRGNLIPAHYDDFRFKEHHLSHKLQHHKAHKANKKIKSQKTNKPSKISYKFNHYTNIINEEKSKKVLPATGQGESIFASLVGMMMIALAALGFKKRDE